MQALKDARKLVERNPQSETARILSSLVIALASDADFPLSKLYTLDYDGFELAIQLLSEWRIDRYYSKKAILLDLSFQVTEMHAEQVVAHVPADASA